MAHPINPVDAFVPGQLYMGCCRNLFLTPITPILGMQHLCSLCEIHYGIFPHISAYADLADGDTPATPAAGGRNQAGHYTVTGGVHLHGLYRLRPGSPVITIAIPLLL